jgi:hypothetical protein
MIEVPTSGLARGVHHEPTQPIGGRLSQASTQRVDPDHRHVDIGLPKAALVRAHLRLVLSLKDHFPAPHFRGRASLEPLSVGLLPTLPLPLPWHQLTIAGQGQDGKMATTSAPGCTRSARVGSNSAADKANSVRTQPVQSSA